MIVCKLLIEFLEAPFISGSMQILHLFVMNDIESQQIMSSA